MTTLRQAIKSKRPGKLTRGVILLHNNARPHTANTITALLQKFKWEVLGHPPYSTDLSPCDYAIFGPLKKALKGKRLISDDDVKQYVRNWFTTPPREFYETAIYRLVLLLTYRYWFLFLGLRLVSSLMPLIYYGGKGADDAEGLTNSCLINNQIISWDRVN